MKCIKQSTNLEVKLALYSLEERIEALEEMLLAIAQECQNEARRRGRV